MSWSLKEKPFLLPGDRRCGLAAGPACESTWAIGSGAATRFTMSGRIPFRPTRAVYILHPWTWSLCENCQLDVPKS